VVVVPTALHVHEREGSHDSNTTAGDQIRAYRDQLDTPLAVGFVGHDTEVEATNPSTITFRGVEHSITNGVRGTHIIDMEGGDLSILAHPGWTFPQETKRQAMDVVDDYGLDGVEKWTGGRRQYEGTLPVLEVAGDDAHSPLGTAYSYLRVNATDTTKDAVLGAIKRGDFDVVNRHRPARKTVHELEKYALLAGHYTPLL